MADSLTTIDCADVRRFFSWTHPNSDAAPVAGLTLSLGYSCVTDVCLILTDDSGPMPLVLGTDYTVDLDTGEVTFIVGGATSFFISDTTVITAWFNALVCPPSIPCVTVPCCDESDSYFPPYVTERKTNCFPVATVEFSPQSGTPVDFPINVSLTTDRPDAVIHYTTDGSQPTVDSPVYATAIEVDDDTTVVCAMAIVEGCDPGPVNCAQYINAIPTEGLLGWYIADNLALTDGQNITSWQDESGHSNTLIRADVASPYPKRYGNIVNGHAVCRWVYPSSIPGALTSQMEAGNSGTPINYGSVTVTGYTIVMVHRRKTPSTSFPNMYQTAAHWADSAISLFSQVSGANHALQFDTQSHATPDLTVALNSWQVVSASYDNTEKIGRLKTNDFSSSATADGSAAAILNIIFFQQENGELAEALIYGRKLTDVELSALRQALAFKYGISITV